MLKQEMARVNVDILGISRLKWTEMVMLIQKTIISTTVGNNPLEEMGVALTVNRSSKMQYLGAISKSRK